MTIEVPKIAHCPEESAKIVGNKKKILHVEQRVSSIALLPSFKLILGLEIACSAISKIPCLQQLKIISIIQHKMIHRQVSPTDGIYKLEYKNSNLSTSQENFQLPRSFIQTQKHSASEYDRFRAYLFSSWQFYS